MADAFYEELLLMGIFKQHAKETPTAWKIVWLGIDLDTKRQTIAIPENKQTNTILFFHEEIFNSDIRIRSR